MICYTKANLKVLMESILLTFSVTGFDAAEVPLFVLPLALQISYHAYEFSSVVASEQH